MIKNQMLLGLRTDTANYKDTVYCFTSATDEEILPYTIGYIPWDIMEKCRLFGACGRAVLQGIPETTFNVYKTQSYFEPTKGIPFLYTSRTDAEQSFYHANYTNGQWSLSTMYGDIANTNLRILAGYNTDYYVQNPNIIQNNELNTIRLRFKFYEVLGDGAWSGNTQTTSDMGTRDVDASVTDPENLGISFSISLLSVWGNCTVTQDDWLNCDENGVFFVDGGTYEQGGVTYNHTIVGICIHISTQQVLSSVLSPGMGMMLAENFRNVPAIGDNGWACGWGAVVRNNTSDQFKVRPYDYHRLFQNWYGDEFEFTDDTYFIRTFVVNELNNIITCGATFADLQLIVCTSFPLYRIGNNFYVAEFTDDYYITGKLIPYSQAREWQKNINGDTNVFDPADIPEPGPEPSDDIHNRHTGNTGSLYGSGVGAVSNFVTHWVLDASQVQTFGGHLWKDLLDFDAQGEPIGTQLWKNAKIAVNTYFQTGSFDPGSILELLIGLRYFPINLAKADYATQMTVPAVYFGTGRVGVNVTTNPWKLKDCGIYITGSDMDLSQLSWNKYDDWRDVYNVSASIYIPFCGTYELPWSDIYNGTLHLSYGVDVLSGALTAFVECTLGMSRFLVCVGSGMVGFEVPITATNANRINAAILGDMGNMMGTLFNPSDAAKLTSSLVGAETGNSASIPTGDSEPTVTNAAGSAPIVGQAALAGRVAEIHAGIASRPGITCPALPGGRGWGALTGQRIPFITVRKGRYVEGTGYGHAAGYPRMKIESIGNISGYTQCINPDLSGINCTKAERDMIKQILETGFYA